MPSPSTDPADPAGSSRRGRTDLRRLRRWLWFALLGYLALLFVAASVCDRILFPVPPPSYQRDDPDLVSLHPSDPEYGEDSTLPALWLPQPDAPWTMLYFHANAEDIGALRATAAEWRRRLGVAVLAVEYPGYGRAAGAPSETGCYAAADAAYRHLRDTLKIPPEKILVYGRSLGGGAAVDLAARRPVGALILESTFLSAFRVQTGIRLFPIDRFNSIAKIGAVTAPLLVIHGTTDGLVPYRHGKKLYEAAENARSRQLLPILGADHNNVLRVGGDAYWNTIRDFLSGVTPATPGHPSHTWQPQGLDQ